MKDKLAIFTSLVLMTYWFAPQALANSDMWLTYKTRGVQAQESHDLSSAEAQFQKALQEAEKSGSDQRIVETLDHLVHVTVLQGKLRAAEPFYERALEAAISGRSKPIDQKAISFWMNDLGDFYFKIGEFSPNEGVKEYCMQHYIDSKIVGSDKYDPLLVPRINLLTVKYYMQGQYADAEQLKSKALIGINRDPKKGSLHIATEEMGNFLLLQNKFVEAEKYYRQAFLLNNRLDPANKVSHEGNLERRLGTIELEKKNWNAAEAHLITACKLHMSSKADREVAFDSYVLGLIEDKKGNHQASVQYFQQSLRISQKLRSYTNPSLVAMSAEHLASELNKQANYDAAKKAITYAKTMRAAHPEWGKVSNPDPETFFVVAEALPFPTDVIPTRTHLDLN